MRSGEVNTVHVSQEDQLPTRDRLLQHGRDLYLELGPQNFSLREVARRVGVSPAAVYRHFDHKEALLSAVCQEGFRIFASYLMRALAASTPLERMRATRDMYGRFALEHPRDYHMIFLTSAQDLGWHASPPKTGGATFQFLVDRVHECMADGTIAVGDAVEVAVCIWANVHGMVALRLCGHLASTGSTDAEFMQLFRLSSDRFLRGLAV